MQTPDSPIIYLGACFAVAGWLWLLTSAITSHLKRPPWTTLTKLQAAASASAGPLLISYLLSDSVFIWYAVPFTAGAFFWPIVPVWVMKSTWNSIPEKWRYELVRPHP